jgi:predicted nucleotidyltransferase
MNLFKNLFKHKEIIFLENKIKEKRNERHQLCLKAKKEQIQYKETCNKLKECSNLKKTFVDIVENSHMSTNVNPDFLNTLHLNKIDKELEELEEKLINKKGEIKRSKRSFYWQLPAYILAAYGLYDLVIVKLGILKLIQSIFK